MVFFPLFSSLAIGSVFSYSVGALYVWMMTVVQIYRLIALECDVTTVRPGRFSFKSYPAPLVIFTPRLVILAHFLHFAHTRV